MLNINENEVWEACYFCYFLKFFSYEFEFVFKKYLEKIKIYVVFTVKYRNNIYFIL